MKKAALLCILFAVLATCHLACGPNPSQTSGYGPKHAAIQGPQRIITIAPSVTEILFAMGQGGRIAGVTDFCEFPPQVKNLPRVGAFINPNLERLTALQPDLVIVQGQQEKMSGFCTSRQIPLMHVDIYSLAALHQEIQNLGAVLGCPGQARKLSDTIGADLDSIKTRVSHYRPKKVFICIGRAPDGLNAVYTAGRKSFVSELIAVAGGENIFSDVSMLYPEASKESILARGPEVIIEMRPNENLTPEKIEAIKKDWSLLSDVPAVRTGNIHVLGDDLLLIPGPRVGQAAKAVARILHPAAWRSDA